MPEDLEGAEVTEGRMEYNKDGPHFVPGRVMEINGVKTFIPGKAVVDDSGEEVFVPGKMIETKNGPKFVPGQVSRSKLRKRSKIYLIKNLCIAKNNCLRLLRHKKERSLSLVKFSTLRPAPSLCLAK